MTILNFCDGYQKYFEVVPANTEELRRHNYRLRHEVYCRDLGFEPENEAGLEVDRFDRHAIHCLIRSRASGIYVGCARLILTDPAMPDQQLPFERTCDGILNASAADLAKANRARIAEVSRLAILGRYRRRKGEAREPFALDCEFGTGTHVRLPYLPVAMYLALLAMAQENSIEYLFVLTEPKLAASISRFGVRVQQIGAPVHFRGKRIPSLIVVEEIIAGLNDYVRPFFAAISAEIKTASRTETADLIHSSRTIRRA